MFDFPKNHFDLFGLPVGFIVDNDELARRYRDLQKVMHPDRFVNATAQERRLSMQGAADINEAYQTLKDPLARARYLLSLHGIDPDGDEGTNADADFLLEQMSMREELAEAKQQSDPYAVVNDLLSRINQKINRLLGQMAVQFETATPEQLKQAREILDKMQFLHKLRAQAEAVEAELEESL